VTGLQTFYEFIKVKNGKIFTDLFYTINFRHFRHLH
jgi:hypothetical protein